MAASELMPECVPTMETEVLRLVECVQLGLCVNVLDPFSGTGTIAKVLGGRHRRVVTNGICLQLVQSPAQSSRAGQASASHAQGQASSMPANACAVTTLAHDILPLRTLTRRRQRREGPWRSR